MKPMSNPVHHTEWGRQDHPQIHAVTPNALQIRGVKHAYGSKTILKELSFHVKSGEWVGIIGPNGSGKSTLLSLLSRAERLQSGHIEVYDKPIASYKRKELSQLMAVLQQEALPSLPFTVREIVEMGRFPHQSWFGSEKTDSTKLVDDIMRRLELTELSEQPLEQLSGGQRQRAALGKLMAQSPSLVLLDEPTTYLDIHHQVQFMDVISEWQQDCGLTVVSVLHDLNLAALYCDRMIVLHQGHLVADGAPEEIMSTKILSEVFETRTVIVSHPEVEKPQVLVCTDKYSKNR